MSKKHQTLADVLRFVGVEPDPHDSDALIIPREEWENYRKALWLEMKVYGYPAQCAAIACADQSAQHLMDMGFMDIFGVYTPAAHAFAKEMEPTP